MNMSRQDKIRLQEGADNPSTPGPDALNQGFGSMRLGAHNFLRQEAGRLRAQANQLEALADALPAKLPADADEALWMLLVRMPR